MLMAILSEAGPTIEMAATACFGREALLSSFVRDVPQYAQRKCGKSGYHNRLN